MAKNIKKKTVTKKVENKKEVKMICIPAKRAVILAIETSVIFGFLFAWMIASFLIDINYFENEVAISNLIWVFFPVLFVIIGLIILTYILMCKSISQNK